MEGENYARVILQCRPSSHPFNEREISLAAPVKIGRAVAGCKPLADNGYFNCKVLSRNHAVLWYENGKFFLQDTQSSNGTFVNNQKLPTTATPVATSPGSLNGTPQNTLKEDSRNDGRKELCSQDIVQFGVEVLEQAKKGAQPVTHGCIVASLKLYHPDGTEAKAQSSKFTIIQTASEGAKRDDQFPMQGDAPKLTMMEIYELQTVLQEAHHREQILESKLLALNKILAAMEQKDSWRATFHEDLLLSKIQYLEGRLHLYERQACGEKIGLNGHAVESMTSNAPLDRSTCDGENEAADTEGSKTFLHKVRDATLISDDYKLRLIAEWKNMLEERSNFENLAKDALQKALADKLEVVKALAISEERLYLVQNECDDLSTLCQHTQKDLLTLVEKFTAQSQSLDDLTRTYQESEKVKLECLDTLRADKSRLEEQISELQENLEARQEQCDKLRRANEKLSRRSDIENGHNGDIDHGASPDQNEDGHRINPELADSGSDEDLLFPHVKFSDRSNHHHHKSSSNLNLPAALAESRENIFQGKDVAQLVKDMKDLDSSDDDAEEYQQNGEAEAVAGLSNGVRDGDFSSTPSSEEKAQDGQLLTRSRLWNPDDESTRVSFEALPTVDKLKNGRSPYRAQDTVVPTRTSFSSNDAVEEDKLDNEMKQLLAGNERLTDLVTRLQAELLAEREHVRRLSAAHPPFAREPSLSFEHGDSGGLVFPSPPSADIPSPFYTVATVAETDKKEVSNTSLEEADLSNPQLELSSIMEELRDLNESVNNEFRPATLSAFLGCHDPVALGLLLLIFLWLCCVFCYSPE
ncbi:Sarcolemmal membrane-associated protein [Hypsibius exemplaris]|uniref:Sarcolemmal membrane-associated protein n=1 Tax=Hypsibius exemplaris TaxID=2072580 RepID=A0A1W0WWK7_HYPEX|nr:Sarcolemmal membrane-associated protein [Hypsibius exemplaris]